MGKLAGSHRLDKVVWLQAAIRGLLARMKARGGSLRAGGKSARENKGISLLDVARSARRGEADEDINEGVMGGGASESKTGAVDRDTRGNESDGSDDSALEPDLEEVVGGKGGGMGGAAGLSEHGQASMKEGGDVLDQWGTDSGALPDAMPRSEEDQGVEGIDGPVGGDGDGTGDLAEGGGSTVAASEWQAYDWSTGGFNVPSSMDDPNIVYTDEAGRSYTQAGYWAEDGQFYGWEAGG